MRQLKRPYFKPANGLSKKRTKIPGETQPDANALPNDNRECRACFPKYKIFIFFIFTIFTLFLRYSFLLRNNSFGNVECTSNSDENVLRGARLRTSGMLSIENMNASVHDFTRLTIRKANGKPSGCKGIRQFAFSLYFTNTIVHYRKAIESQMSQGDDTVRKKET